MQNGVFAKCGAMEIINLILIGINILRFDIK